MYWITFFITISGGIVTILLLSQIKSDSKHAVLGVNLNRVICPSCDTPQPRVRVPANEEQAMFGGHTCKACGTEMDKYGISIE